MARITLTLLAGGLAFAVSAGVGSAQSTSACDLNSDQKVNVIDVQLAVNMYLGSIPCTATVAGPGVCNQDVVNRITNAAVGSACIVGLGPHSITLNWTASPSANLIGYLIYRATTSGGPYRTVTAAPISGTSYVDLNVDAGLTYFYVATAMNMANQQSAYSVQATATVPTP